MREEAYQAAKRTSQARAYLRAMVDEIGRERVMGMLLELYVELEGSGTAEGAAGRRAPPYVKPRPGSIRAAVLAILRASKASMRRGEIDRAVLSLRPDAKLASIGGCLSTLVATGAVHKRAERRGREHYAIDPAQMDVASSPASSSSEPDEPHHDAIGTA